LAARGYSWSREGERATATATAMAKAASGEGLSIHLCVAVGLMKTDSAHDDGALGGEQWFGGRLGASATEISVWVARQMDVGAHHVSVGRAL